MLSQNSISLSQIVQTTAVVGLKMALDGGFLSRECKPNKFNSKLVNMKHTKTKLFEQ